MAPLRLLLDCDPGHDDAVALMLAARHAEVVGVTTVAGNVPVERTTHNALAVLELLGVEVPVHAGAARPLTAEPVHAAMVHGASGLDGATLPVPRHGPASHDAVGFLVEVTRAEEGLWLVATGPLTNVALALRADPGLAERVAGISLMGGSATHGNRTAVAEFNIWADPEAAEVVFDGGAPLVMAGLHLTHQLRAGPERQAALRATGTRTGAVFADLMQHYGRFYASFYAGEAGSAGPAVHDACAVLAVTHPDLFTRMPAHVAVETEGRHTRGMTVVDVRPLADPLPANADVLMTIDDEGAFAVIVEAAASFP